MGSSALFHLASRGVNVLGIEQFTAAHDRGSSHGQLRVIRKAYFEHPDYVPLLHRAYELWRNLEDSTGRSLLRVNGLVLSGLPAGETIAGTIAASEQHGLPLEVMNSREASVRWPHLLFPEDHQVVHEAAAGMLFVEDCVEAHLFLAMAAGARTRFDERVRSLQFDGNSVQLVTDQATYSAGSLVVCCGAWSPQILGGAIPPLRVLRKIQQWQQLEHATRDAWRNSPIHFFDLPEGAFYGFPTLDGQSVKLAQHSGGEILTDPSQLRREISGADLQPIRDFAAQRLLGVSPHVSSCCACLYTMSPDGHFVIDRHPQHENVVIAAGFSGHGFKFASVVGEVLADLVLTGSTRHPIGFLGLGRFHQSEPQA